MLIKEEKKKIIEDFIKCHTTYFRETGRSNLPRRIYRKKTTIPENKVADYFGGYNNLRKAAIKSINASAREDATIIPKTSSSYNQKYIITSVVEGAPIDNNFFTALKYYSKINNARLLLLWSRGVLSHDRFTKTEISMLQPYLITGFKFNKNLEARDFLLHPAQILPLTGLDRFGSKDTSLIIASTKQMMTSVPRPKGEVPHVIWSTGTLSVPKYSTTRAGALAKQDNTLGALIVEVESDQKFYIRNVEWIKDCFVDLGVAYGPGTKKNVSCEGLVWGDLHSQETDDTALKCAIDQANHLKAKQILIHDLVSLNSISHHNEGKYLTKTFIPHEFNTLKKELDFTKKQLEYIKKNTKSKLVIVQSNHDDFLYRYCDEGYFLKDAHNAVLGAKCFIKFTQGINPIEDYIEDKTITFLKRDESYCIKHIECGIHGHNGSNGAKGSPNCFRKSHNKIILGHSHQPRILGDVYYVGTLSKLQLSYNKGTSSWLHANTAIYSNGGRQLIIWIDNKWKI